MLAVPATAIAKALVRESTAGSSTYARFEAASASALALLVLGQLVGGLLLTPLHLLQLLEAFARCCRVDVVHLVTCRGARRTELLRLALRITHLLLLAALLLLILLLPRQHLLLAIL